MESNIDYQTIERLREIENGLSTLRERRLGIMNDLRASNSKDRMLREKINEVIDEVLDLEKREKKIGMALKEKKRKAKGLSLEKREMINKLRGSKLRLKEISLPRGSFTGLRREMEILEEEYETSNTEASMEKRIMDRMRNLANNISLLEEYDRLNLEIKALNRMLDETAYEIEGIHKEIDETKVQREKLLCVKKKLLEEATQLQKKRDLLEEDYCMKKEKVEIEEGIKGLIEERKGILRKLGIKDTSLTANHVEKILEKREETTKTALSKLSSKEPMSLEEFAALVEKGSI